MQSQVEEQQKRMGQVTGEVADMHTELRGAKTCASPKVKGRTVFNATAAFEERQMLGSMRS
jgi:hypothetical protein